MTDTAACCREVLSTLETVVAQQAQADDPSPSDESTFLAGFLPAVLTRQAPWWSARGVPPKDRLQGLQERPAKITEVGGNCWYFLSSVAVPYLLVFVCYFSSWSSSSFLFFLLFF